MRLIDYLLLAVVAVCAVIAFRVWRRAMKKGGLLRQRLHRQLCAVRQKL